MTWWKYWLQPLFLIVGLASLVLSMNEDLSLEVFQDPQRLQSIDIDMGLFKKQFLASENRLLIYVSVYSFSIYSIEAGYEVRFMNEVKHSMVNFDEGFQFLSCSHETVSILTEKTLYLYKLSNEDYSISYARAFPSQYFDNLTSFTGVATPNHWNISLIVKTGTNEINVLDLRSVVKPISRLITPQVNKGSSEIEKLMVINYGKSVCIFYDDGSLYGLDLVNHTITAFPWLPEGRYYVAHYDYVSNLVLIAMGKILILYDSTTGLESGMIKLNELEKNGIISEKQGWAFDETGTSIVQLRTSTRLYFINIELRKLYSSRLYIKSISNGEVMVGPIRRSSLIQTASNSLDVQGKSFNFYNLKVPHPDFCHLSCGPSCKNPFVPCKNRLKLFSSFLISTTGILVLLFFQSIVLKWIEISKKTTMNFKIVDKYNQSSDMHLEEELLDDFNESINMNVNSPILMKRNRVSSGSSLGLGSKKVSFHDDEDSYNVSRTSRKTNLN